MHLSHEKNALSAGASYPDAGHGLQPSHHFPSTSSTNHSFTCLGRFPLSPPLAVNEGQQVGHAASDSGSPSSAEKD